MIGGLGVLLMVLFGFKNLIYYKYSWTRFYFRMKQKIFWNTFIRGLIQTSMKMQIGFCVTIYALEWETQKDRPQIVMSFILLCILALIIPPFFAFVLYRNRNNLWRPSVKAKIGSLYLGLNTEKLIGLTYTIVFLFRRSLFVVIMFTLMDQPAL